MAEMTDSERDVCVRIATAMGWTCNSYGPLWTPPGGGTYGPLPNFYTDSVAADSLLRWCNDHGVIYVDGHGGKGKRWIVRFTPVGGENVWVKYGSDWKEAVALAADRAIREFPALLKGRV